MKLEEIFPNINEVDRELAESLSRKDSLEKRAETLKEIRDAISGLENTERRHREDEKNKNKKNQKYCSTYFDPGKYDTAYYFVAKITEKDVIASHDFEPKLYGNCPECNSKIPVIMWYAQTYDSPEGDTWEKDAFMICCDKIHKVKHVASSYRFLSFDNCSSTEDIIRNTLSKI